MRYSLSGAELHNPATGLLTATGSLNISSVDSSHGELAGEWTGARRGRV